MMMGPPPLPRPHLVHSLHNHQPPTLPPSADPTPANHAALLATFRARRDAALARRHDELAVFWAHQCVALVRTLDDPSSVIASESYTLATAILHLNQPLRASSIVYPFIAQSLACRVLYAHANLLAGCADDVIGELTDPDTYQELTVVVDPVPVLPGEADRVARMMTMRGGWHIRRMEMTAAKKCLVAAVERDPGAWDAIRALVEFKLLTPDEERYLVDSASGLDVSGLFVGQGANETSSSSTGPARRGGGTSAATAAAQANKKAVSEAIKFLLHAHMASTPPGTLSPSPTLFAPAFNQCISRLDKTYKLAYSPTTHLALGTAQLCASPYPSSSSSSAAAAAHATFGTLWRSLDPHAPTAFVAQIDTYLAQRDVRALQSAVTASLGADTYDRTGLGATAAPSPLVLLMYSEEKYQQYRDSIDFALNAMTSGVPPAPTCVVPGTATVHRDVLVCYAIAAYHLAAALAAADFFHTQSTHHATVTVGLTPTAAAAAASPWNAHMPALRALDAAFALDESFTPGILLHAHACSSLALALASTPVDDPTDLATLAELREAVNKARAFVPNAVEPVWAVARLSRALGEVAVAKRYYDEVEERLRAQGRAGGVEEARVWGEVGGLLAENHQLSEGLNKLQDAVTRLRGKVHARVRVPLITSLVQAIVAMVSQFDDTASPTATSELGKAHVHLLDALAATPPVHRFPLYALQARICDLLRDARGALVAYQSALALKPGDPEMTRKMHVAAALNVDALAERVVSRVREQERKEQGGGGAAEEGEHDELIPRPTATATATATTRGTPRKWFEVQDVDMYYDDDYGDDYGDDDDMQQDEFVIGVASHRASRTWTAMAVAKRSDGNRDDDEDVPRPRWITLHDTKFSAFSSAASAAAFSAAQLDEPTEVLPLSRRDADRDAAANQRSTPSAAAMAAAAAAPPPPGRTNLMSVFERVGAADRRADSTSDPPTGTATATAPTDSGVSGLGGRGGRPLTRQQQLIDEVAADEDGSATDPDSSIDHNSPTVGLMAAAAGGPTTRAAARRAQGQGAASAAVVDDSQVVASPTVAAAAARGARNNARGGAGRGGGGSTRSMRNR